MKSIEKLYNELYSEKVTPQNLAQNILLENYKKINFFKENDMIICEAYCETSTNKHIIYKYSFLMDKLLKLERVENNCTTMLYEREMEIKKLTKKMIKEQVKYA